MDKENIKLIILEIVVSIIAIIILIIATFFLKDDEQENKEILVESISETISERRPIPANLQVLTFTIENETVFIDFEEETITIEEENIVNPYTELINNLTEYEKTLIYKITFAEAGNQEEEGQRAVIEVILNRILSEEFPNTVEGVLSQKHQFSTWNSRNKVRQADQDRIIYILELVATKEPVLSSTDYVFFARGKQTQYATDFVKIQDHWFGVTK